MPSSLSAVTPARLVTLLAKDGWALVLQDELGWSMGKTIDDQHRIVTVPHGKGPLTPGALSMILSSTTTGLGERGLLALIKKHGL
jgi:predicted RNA binding protein YcfA (HicA-like mRNA interferase family)